ncbi:facilitated trehalose transporter Tret1 isoform X2 [Lepeophtheirus salmonis]|uniref:facilitated trehalose transporter Tret1 isoform X2 n=1 Tax=Lepeophtheirus salmonis TaxID=72036 RepID=UPI001AE17C62|nr:facilitated trehalose transporter Tret1-like isoform X1 [Lepeophtheirus salmonis]
MTDVIETRPKSSISIFRQKHVIRQVWVSSQANILHCMQGCVIAMSSIMVPQLLNPVKENVLSLTHDEATWFVSLYSIGYLSGSFLGACQGNYFGARVSLIIDSVTSSIGLLMVGLAPSFPYLLIGRLLCGHASGSGTVTIPIYTSEISLPKVRGMTGSFMSSFLLSGYCIAILLGSSFHWRTTILLLIALPVLSGIFLFMAPDSPVWLLQKGREEEAFKSLSYFRNDIFEVEKEMELIKMSFLATQFNKSESKGFMEESQRKLKRFKSPEFIKPLLICITLTAVFVEWNGIGAISFYMVNFIERVKIPMDPYFAASFIAVGRAIFGIISTIWIGKFPRRHVIMTCIILMIAGSLIISIYHFLLTNNYFVHFEMENNSFISWIPAVGFLIVSFSYISGYAQISYLFQSEILPSDVKSFGCGIIGFADGCSMFVASKIALTLLDKCGVTFYFAYSTGILLISFFFVLFVLPETSGKTLQEIENEFRK